MSTLICELGEDAYTALDSAPGPLLVPVPTLEVRQGVLVQNRRIRWIDRLGPHMAAAHGFENTPVLRVWSIAEEA